MPRTTDGQLELCASGEPLNFQNYTNQFQFPNTCALIFWIVLPLVSKKR